MDKIANYIVIFVILVVLGYMLYRGYAEFEIFQKTHGDDPKVLLVDQSLDGK